MASLPNHSSYAGTSLSAEDNALLHKRSYGSLIFWAVVLSMLALSWRGAEIDPVVFFRDSGNMGEFAKGFFPPNFRDWKIYIDEMLITLEIAVWGTFLAVFFAVPLGLLCSHNVAPLWVYQPLRRLMDAARAINEMVFAMLFIVVVGLGPFAGVLALWVHTTGVLAKLFSEAVESIDHQPVEGIRACGASAAQEIFYGVLPQVLPLWISYALYRFEANVRSASVVGMVGAGGIGQLIWEIIRGFQYTEASAIMIVIIVTVTLIDVISSHIRKLFI